MNKKLEKFYEENHEWLDAAWENKVSFGEWGSGEDAIEPSEDMFWEFVDEKMFEEEESRKSFVAKVAEKLPNWYKNWGWKVDVIILTALMVYVLRGA